MTVTQRLELLVLPVSDPDASIAFYRDVLGWHVDVDTSPAPGMRVVQTTPPGSACSVTFGTGMLDGVAPGSFTGMHLVVDDLLAAREELVAAGADVSALRHFLDGEWQPGPHPDRADYGTFAEVQDPDGNTWVLQEVPSRAG